jgi:hypothetical protein
VERDPDNSQCGERDERRHASAATNIAPMATIIDPQTAASSGSSVFVSQA